MQAEVVRFLLVDDSAENLLALEGLLRREGLELHKARSGTEALELLLVHEYALALLDVQMGGMDGFELAELMRGTERTRRVPIIFLTGVADDDRRRFRGYELGAIDYLLKPVDPQVLRNKATIFFELARQRQEVARQRDELASAADQLSAALHRLEAHRDNSPLAVIEFDARLVLTSWSKGAERLLGWTAEEATGQRVTELLIGNDDDRRNFAPWIADMLVSRPSRGKNRWNTRCKDSGVLDCEWYCSALMSSTGELISVSAEILDITERQRAEETQRLLIAELNHRVKNTLAVVQAIAVQTLRHAKNPDEFATNFTGRLQSVAQAHSLLSDASWRGADFAELALDQLRLGNPEETRVRISGPEIDLAPQFALHLALILHELGTNARKYGALASASGEVVLTWTVDDDLLHMIWTERGGPPVKAPSVRGFGTTLIEESAKAEGGSASVSYRVDGIEWEFKLKLNRPSLAGGVQKRPAASFDDDQRSRNVEASNLSRSLAGRRFLVVEDEPMVAMFVTNCLEDAGAAGIETAPSVEQALEAIAARKFDAAVLDGNLHGHPVDSVAAELARRKTPFLFVSGYGREALPGAYGNATALAKPFTQAQLLQALEEVLPPSGSVVKLRR